MLLTFARITRDASRVVDSADGDATVVVGITNSGVHISGDPGSRLARTIHEAHPEIVVTDDDLRQIYAALRQRAMEGDADAAAVVARLAQIQRASDD
ncbi:MAG: hypothetical protein AAFR38_02120 [Planctomycetota bacterium]